MFFNIKHDAKDYGILTMVDAAEKFISTCTCNQMTKNHEVFRKFRD